MPTGATPQERNPEEVARLAVDFLLRREFSAFNKFYDNTLTGNTATITIPVPTWANNVYYEFLLRCDQAAAVLGCVFKANNDGSASYDEDWDGVSNGAQAQGSAAAGTSWANSVATAGAGAASARVFSYNRGYLGGCQSTVMDKNLHATISFYNAGVYGANMAGRDTFGVWRPSPAVGITSLVLTVAGGGNFVASSSFKCWGV